MERIKIRKREYNLEPSLCQNQGDAQYHDHYLNGVTYRVWSVFEGQTSAAKSLSNLMLRRLEIGDEVGTVTDEFEEMIQRKNASAI
ncbi:MAG: hypothetical protein IJN43_12550 [Ruminococcus sp.]|nr:hypothetical protein [Ruminococcus sp.]